MSSDAEQPWRQYICRACGMIYDEEQGDPDSGIAPGTRFEDIPDDWVCPLCGVVKADFEPFDPAQVASASSDTEPPAVVQREAGVVIVGAGHAGWSVVTALRALDLDVPITLVSACGGDRYHKPELSVALSRGASPEGLVRESAADAAQRLGVRLVTETFVVGLSPSIRQLRTTRGTLEYTRLVLAQGARPSLPACLPPSLCWRVNDLTGWAALQERIKDASRRILIVGAGMVGCELAEDFARSGHSVTLLDTQLLPLGGLLPDVAARRLLDGLEASGVHFVGGVAVSSVAAGENGGRRVETECGGVFQADEVVAATGLATEPRLARIAGLDFYRGIAVDAETLQTSAEHVYALGDCVSVAGEPCRFIEPITKQAEVIAHAIVGQSHPGYSHRSPVIRLKTRAQPVVMHGQSRRDGRWQVVSQQEDYLHMQQWFDGQAVASVEVGRAQARTAV